MRRSRSGARSRVQEKRLCALIGGETAEMPGMYRDGEYDLAGFIVGAVEQKQMLTGESIETGDLLLGLPSNGLHTNGYSLARKLLFEVASYRPETMIPEFGVPLAEELLKIHRSYLSPIQALHQAKLLKGAAHITGGGITDNVPRILPRHRGVEIDIKSWPKQPIFELLKKLGNIPDEDYRRTFNLGIGMVLVIPSKKLGSVSQLLRKLRESFFEIGQVVEWKGARHPRVTYL